MKTISFTDFRKNASALMTEVENGEIIHILRHGKPVAEIIPFHKELSTPSWKNPALRLAINGMSLSKAIIEERKLRA
ncbi:MAG: type II toxin-antitoxin system Phd/YefM family antitoxin [Candidatus Anammoxibacter sp.]